MYEVDDKMAITMGEESKFSIEYSHSEHFWDIYSIHKGKEFITSMRVEKGKIVPTISYAGLCKDVGCFKIFTKKTYDDDEKTDDISEDNRQ